MHFAFIIYIWSSDYIELKAIFMILSSVFFSSFFFTKTALTKGLLFAEADVIE